MLLEAGAVRFKPILLTALAAMIGAATILVDPIFQGLAISLLFGLASSTLLTVLVNSTATLGRSRPQGRPFAISGTVVLGRQPLLQKSRHHRHQHVRICWLRDPRFALGHHFSHLVVSRVDDVWDAALPKTDAKGGAVIASDAVVEYGGRKPVRLYKSRSVRQLAGRRNLGTNPLKRVYDIKCDRGSPSTTRIERPAKLAPVPFMVFLAARPSAIAQDMTKLVVGQLCPEPSTAPKKATNRRSTVRTDCTLAGASDAAEHV